MGVERSTADPPGQRLPGVSAKLVSGGDGLEIARRSKMTQALIESGKNLLVLVGGLAAFCLFCAFMFFVSGPLERLGEKLWYRKLKAQIERIFYIGSLVVCAVCLLVWIFQPVISYLLGKN
jgi:hypothetical protein